MKIKSYVTMVFLIRYYIFWVYTSSNIPIIHSTCVCSIGIMHMVHKLILDIVTFDYFSWKYQEIISNPSVWYLEAHNGPLGSLWLKNAENVSAPTTSVEKYAGVHKMEMASSYEEIVTIFVSCFFIIIPHSNSHPPDSSST